MASPRIELRPQEVRKLGSPICHQRQRQCAQLHPDFFSTAFDPREWTMVVFWKEDSGRPASTDYTNTEEEMRPALHHHQDLPSLRILMFLSIFLTHLRRLLGLLDYHQDCSQLLHLLMGDEEQELEMYRVRDHNHNLIHWRVN